MTEEEVQQIYDYLHEIYWYKDGELISKIDCGKRHIYKGSKAGFIKQDSPSNTQTYLRVTINKKSFDHPISFFIFLYHKKMWPERIIFKDGNGMNSSIENLILTTKKQMEHEKAILKNGFYKKILKSGKVKYQALLNTSIGFIYLGTYDSKKDAGDIHKHARSKYIKCKDEKQVYSFKKAITEEIHIKNASRYKGYVWDKNAYQVKIYHNKVVYQIGRYNTSEKAKQAYLEAKESLRKNTFNFEKKILNPLGRGVSKSHKRFKASIRENGIPKYLGTFDTPEEAHAAYLKAKEEYAQNA